MQININFLIGSSIALFSAFAWGLSTVLWKIIGEELSAYSINLCKGIIGIIYILIILCFIGFIHIDLTDFIFLAVSGLLGITLADTFFFKSLIFLGPRISSLIGTLMPVSIAISSFVILKERPSLLSWTGILITSIGVAWVLNERIKINSIVKNKKKGIRYALLSIICTTISVILAKVAIKDVPSMQATFIRLFFGIIALAIWGLARKELTLWIKPLSEKRMLKKLLFIVIISVFGGFWLSLLALKYIDVSIASALSSTTPIFILPLVVIFLKEKLNPKAYIAAIITVLGVILIIIGGN